MRNYTLIYVLLALLCPLGRTQAQTIRCSSDDGHRRFCAADTRGGVELVRQISGSPCKQGYSWGYDARGIWVDHGCRADFALQAREEEREGPAPVMINCSSEDEGRHFCAADTRFGAQLVNQRSGSPCRLDYSWGYDERGIWVDHGCRADFALGVAEAPVFSRIIRCSSDDERRNFCEVEMRRARVRLLKQVSGSPCVEGSTWGHDERGIWVDRGCRAEFLVEGGGFREHRSCRESDGEQRAHELVEKCLRVSPGMHAPCREERSCRELREEIRRSCELLGPDAPRFCHEDR